jgi:hypothetical protein
MHLVSLFVLRLLALSVLLSQYVTESTEERTDHSIAAKSSFALKKTRSPVAK